MERDELSGWLRLALTPGVGDASVRRLLAAFGLPDAVLSRSADALAQVVSPAQAEALQRVPEPLGGQLDRTWDWLQAREASGAVHRIVTLGDGAYPASLLETADPPTMLYLVGPPQFDLTQLQRGIAMVGSRNPTPQGSANASAFARAFSEMGITVVSGLALGIDGAAHQGALDGLAPEERDGRVPARQLATVAVVGTGLDRVYPARHQQLAHAIASHGLLVSEFPLGTQPLAPNFPKRNRIISGLTRGTLVVEAALASGSLITARMAGEQGREVFAIPGSIHSPQSRGCHALIRQGAKLVETAADVLEELGLESGAANSSATAPRTLAKNRVPATADGPGKGDEAVYGDLDAAREASPGHPISPRPLQSDAAASHGPGPAPADTPLLEALGHDPASLEALVARTGWSAAELQVQLLELELDGHVARLPGGLFQRIGQA